MVSDGKIETMNSVPVAVSSTSCSLGNITSVVDRRRPCPSPPYQPYSAATDVRQESARVLSSSSSNVQSAGNPQSNTVCSPPPVPGRDPPVQEWGSQSLTRSSTRIADDRFSGIWPSNAPVASSMPSIPRECDPGGDTTCRPAAEPTVSTKDWLEALHSKKNVLPTSQSTDRMFVVSLNPAGGRQSLGSGGPGLQGPFALRGAEGSTTPSHSTLAGSDDSFAVTETSSRHSLNSHDSLSSQDCPNNRSDSSSSKKRRVRFELQPTTVRGGSEHRQRSRSFRDRQRRTVGDQPSGTCGVTTSDADNIESREAASQAAPGSLFSKFRRVVVDGVGALFGLSKQKNSDAENLSGAAPTCNGHAVPAGGSTFDDMTEMERLATVADRIASDRLHSAVLHGKLPTESGCRSGCRSQGRPEMSSSDAELANVEARFAGLSIASPGPRQLEQLPRRNQHDFTSWCGRSSCSVSEELCRLPSNGCSNSYVQFMPKSMTVPNCSIGSTHDVQPSAGCKKPPSASSTMGNVVLIQCQCGGMSESEPRLPTTNFSNTSSGTDSYRGGAKNSGNMPEEANAINSHAEPPSILNAESQPANSTTGLAWQESSVNTAARQDVELRRCTSDISRLREKPQPPPKKVLQPSTTCFREGLLPPPSAAGVEDFRIRRPVGTPIHTSQNGPLKASVPFFKQPNIGNSAVSGMSNANATSPQPLPTRNFAASAVCGLSTESDFEAQGMTLQELSALVDRELRENERMEMSSDYLETRQPLSSTAANCSGNISNHVDSSAVISSSTCGWKPAAVQSEDDVDAQLKSLGFDEAIWKLELDEFLVGEKKNTTNATDDEEEDSASTLTDCSVGSVVTVTSTLLAGNERSTSPSPSESSSQLSSLTNVVDVVSGRVSMESLRSVDDPFSRSSKPSSITLGTSLSYPAISDVAKVWPAGGDPAHPRRSSTDIPVERICGEDVRVGWKLPGAFSFNQMTSATTAVAPCSPYNSKSSGIGSLVDSGSVPSSPL